MKKAMEQLLKETKQLRKENEQLKYRVQELEARTKKKTVLIAICPHLLTVLRKGVPPASRLAKSLADKKDIKERHSVKWNTHIIVSSIAYINVKAHVQESDAKEESIVAHGCRFYFLVF